MPFIPGDTRLKYNRLLDKLLDTLHDSSDDDTGTLSANTTYCIYYLLVKLYGSGRWFNRAQSLLILESARSEFYRNFVAEYEDRKKQSYGDIVYG